MPTTACSPTHAMPDGDTLAQLFLDTAGPGDLGPVFLEYEGDPEGAIQRLLAERTGDARAVWTRPGLGKIDLIWGGQKFGLRKIAAKHPEAIKKLPAMLKSGRIVLDPGGRLAYLVGDGSPTHLTILRLEMFGSPKIWVLTSYDDLKGEAAKHIALIDAESGTKRLDAAEANCYPGAWPPAAMVPNHFDAVKFGLLDDAWAAHQAGVQRAGSKGNANPPTDAQARAGNYSLGHTTWKGMPVRIENPAHSERRGVGEDGKPWFSTMAADYGYLAGTRGADGDPIDIFMGPYPESPVAWILNQTTKDGRFDEHKVLAGFTDKTAALNAYKHSYPKGWRRFEDPIQVTPKQVRWWSKYADTGRRFFLNMLPRKVIMDTTAELPRVFWTAEAQPGAAKTMAQLHYELRVFDGVEGLLMDPMTMAELVEGEEVLAMDALVIEAGRLKPKMEALMGLMNKAGGDALQVLAVQFSDVLKRFGGAHVAAIYELSDGQTITAWFHNPDSTPTKLTPADELVSWKWLLNKRDITITVAPENGQDLNVRDVARRVMTIAAKNSAAFTKANGKRAERLQVIAGLKTELTEKQGILADLNVQIETAKGERDARAATKAEEPAVDPAPVEEPATPAQPAYEDWEFDLIRALEEQGELTTSDAQGILEVPDNTATARAQYEAGATPEDAARAILGEIPPDDEGEPEEIPATEELVAPEPEPAAEAPEVATLRAIAAGDNDSEDLGDVYDKMAAAIDALSAAGLLTGDVEAVANDAITHWAELDQAQNG